MVSAADQVKSMLELQQHQLPGSYGLYRPPYGNNQPGTPDPASFGANRTGHLGGYPFAPMPGQNSYTGYHHLGYPTSQSPVRDGKNILKEKKPRQIGDCYFGKKIIIHWVDYFLCLSK